MRLNILQTNAAIVMWWYWWNYRWSRLLDYSALTNGPTAVGCQSLASLLIQNDHGTPHPNCYMQLISQHCWHLDCNQFRDVVSCYCCLSSSIAGATFGEANFSWCYLRLVFKVISLTDWLWANGTNIGRLLMFVWVLLFKKLIATALIGTYIYRVPYFFV